MDIVKGSVPHLLYNCFNNRCKPVHALTVYYESDQFPPVYVRQKLIFLVSMWVKEHVYIDTVKGIPGARDNSKNLLSP